MAFGHEESVIASSFGILTDTGDDHAAYHELFFGFNGGIFFVGGFQDNFSSLFKIIFHRPFTIYLRDHHILMLRVFALFYND